MDGNENALAFTIQWSVDDSDEVEIADP